VEHRQSKGTSRGKTGASRRMTVRQSKVRLPIGWEGPRFARYAAERVQVTKERIQSLAIAKPLVGLSDLRLLRSFASQGQSCHVD
jgi:hypothetical protein